MCSGCKPSNKLVGEMVGVGTSHQHGNKLSKMRLCVSSTAGGTLVVSGLTSADVGKCGCQ